VSVTEALERLAAAESEDEARRIEAELLVQSDNRPRDGDPPQPEADDDDDG
jgi:hypothetical protein